jgi:glycosyltransferase involved in cell wall biosynthesis
MDIEVIVVDDGSTDDTWDYVLVNYPGITLLENKGKGAAAARNTGLKAARGEYILYLDSDDLLEPGFFAKKLKTLQQDKRYHACYGNYDYFEGEGDFDGTNTQFKNKYPLLAGGEDTGQHLALYLSGKYLPANTLLWRKDFLLKLNGHDESLIINQDVDIFFRAVFAGLRLTSVEDGTRALIRNHAADTRVGDARNATHKWEQMLEIREKVWAQMQAKGYTDKTFARPLSYYIFSRWKTLRHTHPGIAARYLGFARKVYWPIELRGNPFLKLAGKILGPVRVINLKYALLKRD